MKNTTRKSLATCAMAGVLALLLGACDDKEASKGDKIALAQLPPAVKATIERESKGDSVKEAEKSTEGGKTMYAAEIVVNGEEQEVRIAEDGTVIERGKKEDDD